MPLPDAVQQGLYKLWNSDSYKSASSDAKQKQVRQVLLKDPKFKSLPSDGDRGKAVNRFLTPPPAPTGEAPGAAGPTQPPLPQPNNTPVGGTTLKPGGDQIGRLTPGTPTSGWDAAIDAAMMLPIPGLEEGGMAAKLAEKTGVAPLARLGMRVGIPAAAGAAIRGTQAAVEGKPIGEAATEGAAETGVPAMAMEPANALGTALGHGSAASFNKDYVRGLGKTLAEHLPELGGKLNDVAGWDKLFRGGEATEKIGKVVESANKNVNKVIGEDHLIPNITGDLPQQSPKHMVDTGHGPENMGRTFDEVNKDIKFANDAFKLSSSGTAAEKAAAKISKGAAQETVQYIGQYLNSKEAGLGDRWMGARMKYAQAATLQDLFQTKGLIVDGRLNVPKFQELLAESADFRGDIERMFGGPGGKNDVLEKAFRGASPIKTDKTGKGVVGGASMHGLTGWRAFMHAPSLARHVGAVPVDLGRSKAIQGFMKLGALKFYHVILNQAEKANAPTK